MPELAYTENKLIYLLEFQSKFHEICCVHNSLNFKTNLWVSLSLVERNVRYIRICEQLSVSNRTTTFVKLSIPFALETIKENAPNVCHSHSAENQMSKLINLPIDYQTAAGQQYLAGTVHWQQHKRSLSNCSVVQCHDDVDEERPLACCAWCWREKVEWFTLDDIWAS